MTDSQFQKLLDRLSVAHAKYTALLKRAEDECERRYGVSPPEIDADAWIDTFHVSGGKMTVEEVDETMRFHLSLS